MLAIWVYDTGASGHVASLSNAGEFASIVQKGRAIINETARGRVIVDQNLSVRGSTLAGLLVSMVLMKDSPALVSAGKCNAGGFSSQWAFGYIPCMINCFDGKLLLSAS